jgi:hypothetical protein
MRVGRLTLAEDFTISESASATGRSFTLAGSQTMPKLTRVRIEQLREDVLNLVGQNIPITFTEKVNLNGFYNVTSSSANLTNWYGDLVTMTWSLSLTRIGVPSNTDFESRLSGATTRSNDFTAIGKRWHAPPVGSAAYWAGSTAPIFVDRSGEEGSVRVYQNLPQGINPRYGVALPNFDKGRARFVDQNGFERTGIDSETAPNNWEISNSLIKVRPLTTGGTLEISTYLGFGTLYGAKTWDILQGVGPAVSMGIADYVTILQNDYFAVAIRLTKSIGTVGRMQVDLVLRRGATFVEIYVQHEFGTTLKIVRLTTEAGTGSTGYITATAADANGLKYFIGSAKTFTADTVNGGISKTATATLDAAVGVQLNASAGNATADLYQQYIGSPAETVTGVGR